MVFNDIPCIIGDYRVVDSDCKILHRYSGYDDKHDDVPPDLSIRRVISIRADVDIVVVEVESIMDQFFDDIKKYFNITYGTVGCSKEWIQSHVSDIAEMTETWYIHSDSKFVEEANGLLSYLNGYLHGMDDFNSYTSGDPDWYTETMGKCKTFDEFVGALHEEVNKND